MFSALLFLIRDDIPLFSQVKVLYPVKTDISAGVVDGSGELCPLVFEIFLTLNVEAAIQTTLTTKTSSIISLSELAPGSSSTRYVIQMAFEKRCRPVKPQRGVVLLSVAQTME